MKTLCAMLLVLLSAACANRDPFAQLMGKPDPDDEKRLFTRDKAIDLHLKGRELAPVEGIWAWSDNLYEVVIFRNAGAAQKSRYADYDYIGLITDARDTERRSDVKLLLKETSLPSAYNGILIGPQGQRYGAAFIYKGNTMETSVPSGPYGAQQKV